MFPSYLGLGLLDLVLLLPLLFQIIFLVIVAFAGVGGNMFLSLASIAGLAFLYVCFRRGYGLVRYARCENEQDRRLVFRYLPVVLVCAYTLIIALIAISQSVPDDRAVFSSFNSIFGVAHFTSVFLFMLFMMFLVPSPWLILAAPLTIYATYASGMAWGFRHFHRPPTPLLSRVMVVILLLAAGSFIFWRAQEMRGSVLVAQQNPDFIEQVVTDRYRPFSKDNLLVPIPDPGLEIERDYPHLDGATAAYPIYAAAVQAIYRNTDAKDIRSLVESSTTPEAYKRLIASEVDIIFAAQPSPEQRAQAEAAGVALQLTPIAKEAFIFFVHKDNPVTGLTTEQIREIYTKAISNWSQVGGANEPIVPFQRPSGSGSQTAIEMKVMQGQKLPAPPREEFAQSMGGVIQRVASYRNSRGAIGYSFRYFATTMNANADIKLLAIDGIPPTRETIRDGTYPYTVELYAITAGTKNPHAKAFIDWFLTPAGQKLIDDVGYVGLKRK